MDHAMDPSSVPREVLLAALAVVGALAAGLAIVLAWRRGAKRRAMLARFAVAARGEERAGRLLEGLGYELLGAQVSASYPVQVDDAVYTARVRADYLVGRSGRRYVVEVKTGALAPRIETSATRRQLLEYRVAFAVDGVLLVDADQGHVHAVAFPLADATRAAAARSPSPWWLAALALAAAIAVLALVLR
jgi:hypothetical protein